MASLHPIHSLVMWHLYLCVSLLARRVWVCVGFGLAWLGLWFDAGAFVLRGFVLVALCGQTDRQIVSRQSEIERVRESDSLSIDFVAQDAHLAGLEVPRMRSSVCIL